MQQNRLNLKSEINSLANFTVITCKPSYWIAFSGAREHSIGSN